MTSTNAIARQLNLPQYLPLATSTPADLCSCSYREESRSRLQFPWDLVRVDGRWVLCLQTYPRPDGEEFANSNARVWTMTSEDLEHWEAPELLRVSGPEISTQAMGRMIDPYLLEDKDHPGVWWCLYKERSGLEISRSADLKTWTALGSVSTGENPCVIVDQNDYVLFYSPENGLGIETQYKPESRRRTRSTQAAMESTSCRRPGAPAQAHQTPDVWSRRLRPGTRPPAGLGKLLPTTDARA